MEKPMPVDPMPIDLTKRWVARFLDNLPLGMVTLPIFLLMQKEMIPKAIGISLDILAVLVMFVYFVYMHKRYGQTLGKRNQKIKVCKLDGSPVRLREVLSREILLLAITLYAIISDSLNPDCYNFANILMGIDILFALVRSDNRALHDLIAGTKVVAAPEVASEKIDDVVESH